MKVGLLQSNYLPWIGYFDIINRADLFVFHDDLQYTKGDWRNRNKIKTPNGLKWLTIPVGNNEKRLICEVEINDISWQKKHWNLLKGNYQKSKFFNYYSDFFEDFYLAKEWKNLSNLNQYLIKHISSNFLNIETEFKDSREFDLQYSKSNRVLELVQKTGFKTYISGPAAKNYLKVENFQFNGIKIEWMEYNNYKEYNQQYPPFQQNVSIVDLLFNCGPNSAEYLNPF